MGEADIINYCNFDETFSTMKHITIPIQIPADILIALNQTQQELKEHLLINTAATLFQEGKLSLGKAIQLSGLSRYEFEKYLAKKKISVSNLTIEQINEEKSV